MKMNPSEIAKIETDVLLDAIQRRWDYDFHQYARASLNRRIASVLNKEGLEMPYQLIPRILYDEDSFESFLTAMSVSVTELFRDPSFFLTLKEKVVPVFETYPFIKIWHAGCASGEEAYSLAILLHEQGLLEKAKIYATDYNKHSLDIAQQGIYSAQDIEQSESAYVEAGGIHSLRSYVVEQYGHLKVADKIKNNITFSYHNLVKDGVFGEMNLIICRNVLIYFDKSLQNHTLKLFSDSLVRKGFLCLGLQESLDFSDLANEFNSVSDYNRIYRRNL
ncbi:MAG: protein-glutamate O-methyltransferase CheR [Pseudomonadales bacterium]|nr:protein-glutamate O-methyltransferase CheR [Pseudomonadales bacterium]